MNFTLGYPHRIFPNRRSFEIEVQGVCGVVASEEEGSVLRNTFSEVYKVVGFENSPRQEGGLSCASWRGG